MKVNTHAHETGGTLEQEDLRGARSIGEKAAADDAVPPTGDRQIETSTC